MIYITGDCHGDYRKFSSDIFPEQKEMTRDDFVIICGDFGIWNDNSEERYCTITLQLKNWGHFWGQNRGGNGVNIGVST